MLGAQAARLPERRSRETSSRASGARAGEPPALPVTASRFSPVSLAVDFVPSVLLCGCS
jgi:hypothetical protein